MTEPSVEELTTDEEWDAAVPIIRQLWSHESEAFVRGWREEEDYQLYGYYVEDDSIAVDPSSDDERTTDDDHERDKLVAVAGLSVQRVLHHRRHAWMHDIVVDEAHRGEGHGEKLLAWIEEWAEDRDCEYVALASYEDNDEGLDFYVDNGMETWGYVVETELD